MIKEHQKIKYLELIKNQTLSKLKNEKFKTQLEASSFLDTYNQPNSNTSLTLSQRWSIDDFIINELLNEQYIEESMQAWTDINQKFLLTLKWNVYLENNKNLLRRIEIYLIDYPLIVTNSIAFLALVISIIALFN